MERTFAKSQSSNLVSLMQVDNEILEKAHYLLRPVCLRRLKEDVEKTLPPRVGHRLTLTLTLTLT